MHSDLTTAATVSSEIAERTPLIARKPSPPESVASDVIVATKPSGRALFVAISYASFSGILSGMCLIFAKSGVELLMLTIGGKNQFWRWEAWVLVLGLVVFALLQLWYLHKSLVLADPTLVCPCE
jgi:magnesium transporter